MTNSKWHWRGLTSLFSLSGLLIMAVTGVVLFIVPHGRIAYWTEWKLLCMTKEQWGDIHILSMFLFLTATGFHVYFNWKPLIGYLKDRAKDGVKLKKELSLALMVSVFVVASGVWRFPPLSYVLDVNGTIKNAWIVEKDYEPPFGHAELLSLKVFCKKTGIPLDKAIAELEAAGWKGVAPGRSLVDIVRDNDRSPLDLYRVIRKLEAPPAPLQVEAFTPQAVEEAFAGTGIGNKSLADIAARLSLPPSELEARLKRKGLDPGDDLSVKQIAQKNGMTAPLEVLKAALVEAYQPTQ